MRNPEGQNLVNIEQDACGSNFEIAKKLVELDQSAELEPEKEHEVIGHSEEQGIPRKPMKDWRDKDWQEPERDITMESKEELETEAIHVAKNFLFDKFGETEEPISVKEIYSNIPIWKKDTLDQLEFSVKFEISFPSVRTEIETKGVLIGNQMYLSWINPVWGEWKNEDDDGNKGNDN